MTETPEVHQNYSPATPENSSAPEIVSRLQAALPLFASGLVRTTQDMSDPANQSFADHPDNPAEHAPDWHQYGILTHSSEFGKVLREQIPAYIEQWDETGRLAEQVESILSEEIDGVSKRDLLQLTALVHDIGKYTTRTLRRDSSGVIINEFTNHEAHSGGIIRDAQSELHQALKQFGLSGAQITYIAECARLHFELGKMRRTAGKNYTIAFTETPAFTEAAQGIINGNPDFALEIGLEFVADSLSKTEVAATVGTDDEIEAQREGLKEKIESRGLNQRLINQALQQPVNMVVAKRYLELWAGVSSTSIST